MITEIEDYFSKGCGRCARFDTPDCSTRLWAQGLADLRALCRAAGLVETVKWGHPCYMHAGRNIALIGAFRDTFRLSFFNASLLDDPADLLEKQGPNSAQAGTVRFTDAAQVTARAPALRALLAQAMAHAKAGRTPARKTTPLKIPAELTDAMDSDPDLAAAFHALTPGRQKSYVLNLNAAKKPETRTARIKAFRERILAGKGAHDR